MSTSLREDDKKSRRTKSRYCWRQINFRNDLCQVYFLLLWHYYGDLCLYYIYIKQ